MLRYDVIIVGAGPAGLSCAYLLAKAGVKVIVLERGPYPGSKNVMGGVLYRQPTEEIIPGFWKEAPLERQIISSGIWLLTKDGVISASHKDKIFGKEPYNSFTVLRSKFDRWFAKKAEEAGALIVTETTAKEVIKDKGKVIGVRTDRAEGDIFAEAVVAADGVNSLLSKNVGLHPDILPQNVALAVKEIIALPKEVIDARFNLRGSEGATIEVVGQLTRGMVGLGFIYTNKDTISVGVGCILSDWVNYKISPYDLIDEMKAHPAIAPLLEGGVPKEYLAHLIPEGGFYAMPPLYADGLLVVGDAGMMVNALHREGSNLAMTSGRFAAQTILRAREKKDFSAKTLSYYKKLLEESFVYKDLRKYKNTKHYLESHRQLFTVYPEILNDAVREFITVDGVPKKEKQKKIIKNVFKKRSILRLLKDLISGWRAIK